ncbi:MAG: hypothetical protein IMY73_02390 [Bacteroidetes bacterium]|nr:hypothetical protein [Bacteroidota bacterium]
MKKFYSILMMIIITGLTSCNKDNEVEKINTNLSTFNLDFKEKTKTENGENLRIFRYVMAVYDEIGANPVNVFGDTNMKIQLGNSTFKAEFEKSKNYKIIFWADEEGEETGVIYDITNLKNIHLKAGAEPTNSFYGNINICGGNITHKSIKMHRSIANIKLFEKGSLKAGSIVKLTYEVPTAVNFVDFNTESQERITKEKTITINSNIKGNELFPIEIGNFYILGSIFSKVSIQLNDNEPILINNILIKSGQITNIVGELEHEEIVTDDKNKVTFDINDYNNNWSNESLVDKYYNNYSKIPLSIDLQFAGINIGHIDDYILPIKENSMEAKIPMSYMLIDKLYTTIKKGTKIKLPFYNYDSNINDKYFVDIWIDWEHDGNYNSEKDLLIHKAINMKEAGGLCENVTYTFNEIPIYAKNASYIRIVSYYVGSDKKFESVYNIACAIEK